RRTPGSHPASERRLAAGEVREEGEGSGRRRRQGEEGKFRGEVGVSEFVTQTAGLRYVAIALALFRNIGDVSRCSRSSKCKSAALEEATSKSPLSGSAAWE